MGKQIDQHIRLVEHFEGYRAHLRAVAYRMLGSLSEADDAVQESWLRLSRAGAADVENLGGWLTTVVARVCLDMLRSRNSRQEREEPIGDYIPEPVPDPASGGDPEHEVVMADSVGLALLVVLDTLAPAERLAFVLHDIFAVPFTEIAPIVGRTPTAARQLASRARRRVRGASADDRARGSAADTARQREVVAAFLAASRAGNFESLLALLDPEVVLRSDSAAVQSGATGDLKGASAVAGNFAGRARAARLALIDGAVGAVWAPGGRPRVVFDFTVEQGKIAKIEIIADPERIGKLNISILSESDKQD